MEMSEVRKLDICCFKCKFWEQQSFENQYKSYICDSEELDGLCKRYAPRPMVYVLDSKDETDLVFVVWPTTYAHDVCGEAIETGKR